MSEQDFIDESFLRALDGWFKLEFELALAGDASVFLTPPKPDENADNRAGEKPPP